MLRRLVRDDDTSMIIPGHASPLPWRGGITLKSRALRNLQCRRHHSHGGRANRYVLGDSFLRSASEPNITPINNTSICYSVEGARCTRALDAKDAARAR